jgi:steroid delta-isomerase-like uncharacterized protein
MPPDELKAMARRFFEEVWNQGSLSALDELTAPEAVAHVVGHRGPIQGVDAIRQTVVMYRSAFPDIHYTVEDQIAEGDKVLSRWTIRATHRGELQGIPPTGKSFTISGMTVDQGRDGQFIQSWINWDMLSMLQQIGVVPEPSGSGKWLIRLMLFFRRLFG